MYRYSRKGRKVNADYFSILQEVWGKLGADLAKELGKLGATDSNIDEWSVNDCTVNFRYKDGAFTVGLVLHNEKLFMSEIRRSDGASNPWSAELGLPSHLDAKNMADWILTFIDDELFNI